MTETSRSLIKFLYSHCIHGFIISERPFILEEIYAEFYYKLYDQKKLIEWEKLKEIDYNGFKYKLYGDKIVLTIRTLSYRFNDFYFYYGSILHFINFIYAIRDRSYLDKNAIIYYTLRYILKDNYI